MTLQELLKRHTFDEIAPFISVVDEGQVGMMPKYKEAYDILCHTKGSGCDGNITVQWTGEGESKPYDICTNYISVDNCEGDLWENNVSKEVVVDEGVHISEEELCARLLWSSTFFGFSEDVDPVRSLGGYKPYSEYGVKAQNVETQLIIRNLSKKYRLEYLKSLNDDEDLICFGGALSFEGWDNHRWHLKHCNRSKRKRNYRMGRLPKELKRKDRIEGLIQRLIKTDIVTPFTPKRRDLDFLFGDFHKQEVVYHSRTYGESSPTEYVLEQLEKYEKADFCKYSHFIVRLATSDRIRLIASGKIFPFIKRVKAKLPQGSSIDWYHCYDNALRDEVKLTIVCCCDNEES